ncbi:MAG: SDR family oxidoreductase [Promethearchaeota archaeon]
MKLEKLVIKQPLKGKIVVIGGGSKGIGLETSKDIVKLGGSLCIIARGKEALKKAANDCEKIITSNKQFVETIICDTTDMDALKPLLEAFIQTHGTPDYLINVVGYAYPQYVEKLTLEDIKKNTDVNFYGQLVPILILLPYFIKAKKGHIANVSSVCGFLGIMGYTTYAPSKFAIVGLTETLRNELSPYNIKFSILYPPDTKTPGFDKENEIKPKECALISEGAKVLSAAQVAEVFIKGILKNKFNIYPGESKFISTMKRLFPKLVFSIIDGDLKKARKKLGKE